MKSFKKFGIGGIAVAGVAALVIGLGSPAMAAGSFDTSTPVVGGPSRVVLPYSGVKDLTITFRFDGPGAPDNTYTAKPRTSVIARNTSIRAGYVLNGLDIHPGSAVEPGTDPYDVPTTAYTAVFVSSTAARLTTPGKYRISIPVTSSPDNVTRTGVKDITVSANASVSKKVSGPSWPSIRPGRTLPITLRVPYYQAGAKVTAYFKAKGTSRWKKVGTGTVKNSNSNFAKAKIKVKGKHTRRAGAFKFKVGSAPYAPGYTTKSTKLKVVQRSY